MKSIKIQKVSVFCKGTVCYTGVMEILAPCGGPAHLKAAVYSGADAVYLGGRNFSARRGAVNFDIPELSEAVRFCHGFGVKVYAAVNILTHDREMPQMEKYLIELSKASPDALIMQDLGAAFLCKKILPEMPLHASTQMSIHSAKGVKFCADAGFTRIIIARECSRAQLEEIIGESPVEIETFVHGALCVSVSGQCEMSAVIGGRSGNRGMCAQPCRLDFTGGKTRSRDESPFALSLKDLSLIEEIPVLEKMGVAAIKIEGRLKRPEYVAAAVTACRAALNGGPVDTAGLKAVFSRDGFTKGYFYNRHENMTGVRTAEDARQTAEILPKYAELMRSPRKRVPVTAEFTAAPDKPVKLSVTDGTDVFTCRGGVPEPAFKRETTAEEIKTRLGRLGDTPFELANTKIELPPGLFFPASGLNALRREAAGGLLEKRIARRKKEYPLCRLEAGPCRQAAEAPSARPFLRVHCESMEQAQAVLPLVSQAVLPISAADIKPSDPDFNLNKIIVSPGRFINDEKTLLQRLEKLSGAGFTRLLCHNPAHVPLGKQAGFPFLHGGMGLNVYNAEAVRFWRAEGLTDATASMELTLNECKTLMKTSGRHTGGGLIPIGLPAYGRLPLMLLRRCPFGRSCRSCPGRLTDRTKRSFPILCRGGHDACGGYRELLNADVLWMADKLPELSGFSFLSVFLHKESPREARAVVDAYTNGGEPPQNFTRGLLYRGVG